MSEDADSKSEVRESRSEVREEFSATGGDCSSRLMDLAITRKRSPLAPPAVEVSHSPSAVTSPSSFWDTQCRRAPSGVGRTDRPSPWYCGPSLAPNSAKEIAALAWPPP